MGRLPGERSCLSLVWAVLDRASRGWRGVEMSPKVVRHLEELRRELLGGRDAEATARTAAPEAAAA